MKICFSIIFLFSFLFLHGQHCRKSTIYFKVNGAFVKIGIEIDFEWETENLNLRMPILSFDKTHLGVSIWNLKSFINIVGQLQAPFEQFTTFIRDAQDAKISLDRMSEITQMPSEEINDSQTLYQIPSKSDIVIENLSFRYSPVSQPILHNIYLTIPRGKITAIVGLSGSGKTTLLKLLLGFYPPSNGKIMLGNVPLGAINTKVWRSKCGTVMQEGYIFSDTIASNIGESDQSINYQKLEKALHIANIDEYVHSLPLSYNTNIGAKGNGLSQGQKQRILIARAVYKNPEFLFFDEATNALDSNNEKIIMENLNAFFEQKTVIVVAHRLSTVKNADQIVVLNQGRIAEIGTHQTLVQQKGLYFGLVQNQLELES